MKDVNICHVFNGVFFVEGIKYQYINSYNTRIICKEVENPEKEIQFSSYSIVQVEDAEAIKVKRFLKDVIGRTKASLNEYEKDMESLNKQNVPDQF